MSKLPKLPLGSQSFETLRAFDEAYVDKTRMIGGLARARARVFLARPRRFGKSLLVSTFASALRTRLAAIFRDLRSKSTGRNKHMMSSNSTFRTLQTSGRLPNLRPG